MRKDSLMATISMRRKYFVFSFFFRDIRVTTAVFGFAFFFFAAQTVFSASASITEIMYDLPSSDSGREWVEIKNTDSLDTAFSQWKFFEGNTNHGLTLFRGAATSSPGDVAVIADDPEKFLIDWPGFSSTLFDSSFSLGNSGETIALKFDGIVIDEVAYASTTGAAGDGNSLQKTVAGWQANIPTPGTAVFPSVSFSGGNSETGSVAGSETASTSSPSVSSDVIAPSVAVPPPPSGGGGWTEPLKANLFVYATAPVRTVAGADAIFEALAVGVKKEPIINARYIWSFGDGGTVEGKKVLHAYHYPGNYAVLVEASSGEWSATARKDISVSAPALSIVSVKEGTDGFIEVLNSGADDVDVSRWFLQSNQTVFSFPKGTILKARQAVPFPSAITRISAVADDTTAILYPNGTVAARYALSPAPPLPAVSVVAAIPAAAQYIAILPQAPAPSEPVSSSKNFVPESKEENEKGAEDKTFVPNASLGASSSELLLAAAETSSGDGGVGIWIVAVAALLAVSVAGYAFAFRAPARALTNAEKLSVEVEEYELVE